MRRREFLGLLGGAAAWPIPAQAQQPLPLVAFVNGGAADAFVDGVAGFRKGLAEAGYAEGQNVTVEYHWLEGQYERMPALVADLARRHVAVIATPVSTPTAVAARAATSTIPIVFGVGDDPVRLGLVASLARPGGNVTGVNSLTLEVVAKRLRLLHDLLPKAVRVAVLLNPANPAGAAATLQQVQEAAPILGLQTQVLHAATIAEIDAAFAAMAQERPDAVFIAPDPFFLGRRVQFATLAAANKIPANYGHPLYARAGGLMSYAPNSVDLYRQAGTYVGRILKGATPADMPVLQPTRYEFIINLQTARLLGIEIPPSVFAIADEVIE